MVTQERQRTYDGSGLLVMQKQKGGDGILMVEVENLRRGGYCRGPRSDASVGVEDRR